MLCHLAFSLPLPFLTLSPFQVEVLTNAPYATTVHAVRYSTTFPPTFLSPHPPIPHLPHLISLTSLTSSPSPPSPPSPSHPSPPSPHLPHPPSLTSLTSPPSSFHPSLTFPLPHLPTPSPSRSLTVLYLTLSYLSETQSWHACLLDCLILSRSNNLR